MSSYRSNYTAYRRMTNPEYIIPDGYHVHHLVSQREARVLGWSEDKIHHSDNLVAVTPLIHSQVHSGEYSKDFIIGASQEGRANMNWKGVKITPWGRFDSTSELIDVIGVKVTWNYLMRLCRDQKTAITKMQYAKSPILHLLGESCIGQTPFELGFDLDETDVNIPRIVYHLPDNCKSTKGFKTGYDAVTLERVGMIKIDDDRWKTGEIVGFSSGSVQSLKTRTKMSKSRKGRSNAYDPVTGCYIGLISVDDERWGLSEIVHSNFKGFYVTPFGTFTSVVGLDEYVLREYGVWGGSATARWCINDHKITQRVYNKSIYLQKNHLLNAVIGKMASELGFGFISKPLKCNLSRGN
jgi:hypothetical protein